MFEEGAADFTRCKVFGPNRTKMFHVKHFGTTDSARNEPRLVGLRGSDKRRPLSGREESLGLLLLGEPCVQTVDIDIIPIEAQAADLAAGAIRLA
jgi:hypothetical protein